MQLEVGAIMTGKVTGITKYGVFVDLGSGKSGMVHISEVASTYVKEIRDFVTDGQEIKVKVLGISDEGKVSLSMKQAVPTQEKSAGAGGGQYRQRRTGGGRSGSQPAFSDSRQTQTAEKTSFDDMLQRFMQTSDEKISDLRRNNGERRASRRGSK